MTPAKPLGEALVTMPLRMPLAKLTSEADTWPEACGTAAGYVFKGYRMTKDGTPVFLYEIGGMKVEDQIKPGPDGKSLHRMFTVHGAGDGWFFMGLSPKATPVKVTFKDGVAVMDETISL